MWRNEYTFYPYDFPADAQANVEAEKLRAGDVFDKTKEKIPASTWGSILDVERLLKQYILSVFAVLAQEACELGRRGAWKVVRVHSECLDFLRGFIIEAHSDKGYDTNGHTLPFRATVNELKDSPEWRTYEEERLEVAELQSVSLKPAPQTSPATVDSPVQEVGHVTTEPIRQIMPSRLRMKRRTWPARLQRQLQRNLVLTITSTSRSWPTRRRKSPGTQGFANFERKAGYHDLSLLANWASVQMRSRSMKKVDFRMQRTKRSTQVFFMCQRTSSFRQIGNYRYVPVSYR
jgi:hypothetical protein